jgi:uncharacterized protein
MVEVRFRRDSRNRLSSVVSRGHADAAEHGEDVVCAAVSALLQAAWLGVADVAGVDVTGRRDPGDFEMRWPEDARDRADVAAIVETAERAVAQIAGQPEYASFVRYRSEPEPRQNRGTPASKGTAR